MVSDLWPGPFAAFPGTEMLQPSEVFAGPGYQAPQPRTDPVAALALGCTLLSLVPGVGILALGLGLWGARRVRTRFATGASLARLAVVVGAAATVAWLWLGALLLLPIS
ncbi:DUF4190 domain-containing protein [Actinomyces sp. 2119]|uniref:DUF4190 domain-containing protein n=1 Tax=Actinomyces lilanjuaniae TaxID=2321394 RepID=A0ABN5PV05_9ACTO|nr:DUF4190 domain-containing protein [Actinomyces lilanjuaniae]RJF44101.1 DUF4190 domain-containing protein [Actinomyces sp. 2119]